jgi:hypothetical protein
MSVVRLRRPPPSCWVACPQFRDAGREALDKLALQIGMNVDPLNRYAHLTRVVIAAFGKWIDDPVQIRATVDDGRRNAAMLQRATGARREFRTQAPANLRRTDTAEKGHPRVGNERLGKLALFRQEGLHPAFGHPRLVHQFHEPETVERRGRRRLDDHRATGRDGRRDLVNDQIQRMIECRNRRDHANRFGNGPCAAIVARRGQTHRDFVAAPATQCIGGIAHAVDGAIRLDQRIRKRLAALPRDQAAEVFAFGLHQRGKLVQHFNTLIWLEPAFAVLE